MPNPLTVQTSSGAQQIELYDPGTFDFEPLRVQTQNGPMVPYITDPSDADTGLRLYTDSRGVQGINSVGVLRIDDFEDGNRDGWTVPGSTGSDSITSPGLNGTNNAWFHNGLREGHLAGADAIDRGPQPGDRFDFWFRVTDQSGTIINRFHFSSDGVDDPDRYRVEWERGDSSGDELSLEKYVGGSQAKIDTAVGAVSVGQTYRCEINWNNGNNQISAELFFPNGNSAIGPVTITDDSQASGGDFTQPGIAVRTNSNCDQIWDEMKILPS